MLLTSVIPYVLAVPGAALIRRWKRIQQKMEHKNLFRARLTTFTLLGVFIGLCLGWMFMATAHAMFLTRGIAPHALEQPGLEQADSKPADTIHALCPSNGSPYQNYQMRIAYATYKLVLGMPGGERHVGFTRILHRTVPDELMEEVPTFRADPLQPKCDDWCEYPVSDRANAVRQFLEAARADPTLIQAPWLYMIESDYVFMKPLQLPVVTNPPVDGWAFDFRYIKPAYHPEAMGKLYPGPVEDIPSTGPAPVLLRREVWEKLTPEWERLAAVIEGDASMRERLGWVREMYGFSAAVALLKLRLDIQKSPASPFISELPVDHDLGNAHAFHYTLCTIFMDRDGGSDIEKAVWKYDKRFFTRPEDATNLKPIPMPPPYKEGAYKFIEGQPVTRDVHEAIEQMIAQMDRGIAALQPLGATS